MAAFLRLVAALLKLLPLRRRVVFMSRQNNKLSLDYRMLMEALKNAYPAVPVLSCLSQPETKNKTGFLYATLKQLYYASTSSVCVLDGYLPAVSIPQKRKGVTVIQLWHAMGAIKCFGYQSLDTPAGRSSESARVGRMHANYDYIVAGGPGAIPAFSQAFEYPKDSILPIGLPRQDYLSNPSRFSSFHKRAAAIKLSHPEFFGSKATILYAPTMHRDKDAIWFARAVASLARYVPRDINLLVAGHPFDCDAADFDSEAYPHVYFVSGITTLDLLELVDCVITDYSAVAFEAGYVKTGVYFYVPDVNDYRQSPGLNIDPLKDLPGCSSADAAELMETMVLGKE